jgi:hypothetical protein
MAHRPSKKRTTANHNGLVNAGDAKQPFCGQDDFPLPPELALEISSYFIHEPRACVGECHRLESLRALSQTCRLLRNICLPLLWEVVDMGCSSTTLERITAGLIENPALAAYVRFVVPPSFSLQFFGATILFHRHFSLNSVKCDLGVPISKLITCLSLLPNMHTLCFEVCDDGGDCWPEAFAKAVFPQVRTLTVSAMDANMLVPCCPQMRTLICTYDSGNIPRLVGVFDDSDSGENLENLASFTLGSAEIECELLCYPASHSTPTQKDECL